MLLIKSNIVFHGMKINKIYTKNTSKEIPVLAINTGSNTSKANLFSNLILKKDKKSFKFLIKNIINIYYFLFSLILFIISISALLILYYVDKNHNSCKNYILIILGFILMPMNFIVENLIRLISVNHLKKYKIQCENESILADSGNIDTVIFSKSGNKALYKIIAFCPLYFEPGTKKISIKEYEQTEEENINKILDSHMKYYRKIAINIDNNDGNDYLKNVNDALKNEELNALFLQCLICCTSLEKINNEICGEIMDKEILEKMDWDINSIEKKNENDENNFYDNKEQSEKLIKIIEEIKKKGNIFINNYDNNINYNSTNTISEVFPKDYYKITEEKNINFKEKRSRNLFSKMISNNSNLNETKIFNLIIIHKFNNISCWSKSCITYNLLDNKCRFMTKGFPHKILKHCKPNIIPEIDKLLSKLIKDGYKIIVYATKILQLNQIDKNKNEDFYLKDLSFVGFIVIENKFKKEISNVIEKIDKMNCYNSISSVISTNDNIYNAIEGGLKSGIINKNNVFAFDIGKEENEGRIIFAKIIYDKEDKVNEQTVKSRHAENNKALIKTIYEKNTFQIINNKNNNNHKEKNIISNEITSMRAADSSRKLINSDSNKETTENNLINNLDELNKYENNALNNEEKKIFQTPSPSHIRGFYKKPSRFIGKNINSFFSNNFQLNKKEHTQSFYVANKTNFNFSKTEDFDINNFTKDSKDEYFFDDDSNLKYKKRRPTTKANLNFTFRNNYSYNYECLFFKRYDNQIQPFKHDCVLCFSGDIIEYIYNQKEKSINKDKINEESGMEKYQLDILLTLLKDRVRVFYSMSSENKSTLVRIYQKYLNKRVCLVGNSASDIESLVLSNIGIMVGPPINFNTLFCHYYLCEKSLLDIEKIMKNGRSYYENISHLLSINSIFTLLFTILIIFTYKLNTNISSIKYIFINTSIFLLCLSGFSIRPDYSVDSNYFVSNRKLFAVYNIIKIIGTIIIKIIEHIYFWINYKNNEENSDIKNNEIFTTYLYIFIWAQMTSIIFGFNTKSYFRKHALNNILFFFLFFVIFEYLIVNLTLSDISIKNYNEFLFICFDFNKDYIDAFEDNHKIIILYTFLIDIIITYLFIKILSIIFEKYSKKEVKKQIKN